MSIKTMENRRYKFEVLINEICQYVYSTYNWPERTVNISNFKIEFIDRGIIIFKLNKGCFKKRQKILCWDNYGEEISYNIKDIREIMDFYKEMTEYTNPYIDIMSENMNYIKSLSKI